MKAVSFWLALLAALPCAARDEKIADDLNVNQQNGEVAVIVQFASDASDQDTRDVEAKGGKLKVKLGSIEAFSLPVSSIQGVAALPNVVYVSPDRRVHKQLNYTAAAVNAGLAWQYGWSGKGIGIAIVDSGISPSADLLSGKKDSSRVVYSEAFGGLTGTADLYGHGTHVAGIAAGDGSASQGAMSGIARGADLINLRVLDENGEGSDSAVIAAISRAIELMKKYNIRVLNVSLGRPVYESYRRDPLCRAAEIAWKAGIVVVAAAGNGGRDNTFGNQGYGTILSPGNDPYVITVGAMKAMNTLSRGDDLIASYSAKGPTAIDHIAKPDLVAPGNQVVSTIGTGTHTLCNLYPQNVVGGGYFRLSGTSMAAPVVAGAAALLLEQNSSLTPDQVKARLMKTATKSFPSGSFATDPASGVTYASAYDFLTVGAGYLDINAALNSPDLAARQALSPATVYDSSTRTVSMVADSSVIWGSSVVWGSSAIWGASVIWGSSVVWADATPNGLSVIWGSSVVWADTFTGGERTSVLGEK
jgi:serine protease AprX